ncbi:MAG: phosphoserine transaminase [Spirochaetales bacterium]|nr:phosphoserine transaminase [Spirochaetales bacterium]
MSRKLNFSAGPCAIPLEVLNEMQENFADYQGNGISLAEVSHRHKLYDDVHNEAISLMKELLKVPDNYSILFLGGGGTLAFTMIPMNFLGQGQTADYVNSGTWAKKAIDDAKKVGNVNVVFDGKDSGYSTLPSASSMKASDGSAYFHFTSNETIGGIQWKDWPELGDTPVICDMSSDIMSREIPFEKFAMVYGGVQKNLGPAGAAFMIIRNDLLERSPDNLTAYLNYKTHAEKNAMYNTPPVFTIWGVKLFLEWVKKNGGISGMEKLTEKKSKLIYDILDSGDNFYKSPVDAAFRSTMNVVFRMPSEDLEAQFVKEAAAEGMMFLKGHRSVGGCRASIYNGVPESAVIALTDFMKEFNRKNG